MDENAHKASEEKTGCACTHPTHFLGRCQVKIDASEKLCAPCMQDHFTRNDDPTIVIE